MTTYKVKRFHHNADHPEHGKIVKGGLTLEEAREHCQREDTQEKAEDGSLIWFDAYTKEN